MAGTLFTNQMIFTVDTADVKPECELDDRRNRAFGHLHRGWDGSNWSSDAVLWSASVPTNLPFAEFRDWNLGFVQIAEATQFRSFYSGRIPKEGSISIDYFIPPALTSTVLLDGAEKGAPVPWYRSPAGNLGNGRASAASGDHPGMAVPLRLDNRSADGTPRNFLFHVQMDRRFTTVFAAQEPGKSIQFIGHFVWRVRYEFLFKWMDDKPLLDRNRSIVSIPATGTRGRPTEPSIQTMLDAPKVPRANDAGLAAQLKAEAFNAPNRFDLKDRFINTPGDFWLKH